MYDQKLLQAEQVLEEERGLLDVERDDFGEIHWLVILRFVTYLKMLLLIYIGDFYLPSHQKYLRMLWLSRRKFYCLFRFISSCIIQPCYVRFLKHFVVV